MLLKTLAKAMMAWPVLRSSITPGSANGGGKPTLTIRPHADIAVALSTTTGLYTPVIPHADTHSIYSLSSQLKHLSFLGRQVPCALTMNEMPKRGATVTISNVGAIGDGEYAHPVLVPGGGVAIVAIGRARWVWDVSKSDQGERRLKVGVSWSADHRVLEGAELAAFVETWRAYVEAPERLIGEGI
jgi:2-oxoisovalerate dehydrogenase E2 component (dihydrolipoyl transacylase)